MPNWVVQRLQVEGKNANKVLKELIKTEDDGSLSFDFNKIIPMPESLNVVAGSISDDCVLLFLEHIKKEKNFSKYYNAYRENKAYKKTTYAERKKIMKQCLEYIDHPDKNKLFATEEDVYNYGKKILDNYIKYGSMNWYDWCCTNWGTKWNACNTTYDENYPDVVWFDTAWSNVRQLIYELSTRYPENKFIYDYAEEDIGAQTGYCEFQNGNIIKDIEYPNFSKEAYEKAFELWGEGFAEDYKFNEETKTYDYNEDDGTDEEM